MKRETSKRGGRRQIELLLDLLDSAYEKKAWHGPNLKGALRGLTPRQAAWRPALSRHNIWEVAVHAAYWKYAVTRRLKGEKRGSFPVKGSNWFQRPVSSTEQAWRQDLALLDEQHRKLRAAVEELPVAALDRRSAGSAQKNVTLISGIAAHDLYHTGQIRLLKVLYRQSKAGSGRRGG